MNREKRTAVFVIATALLFCGLLLSAPAAQTVRHKTERFTFESGRFQVVGELRIPEGEGEFPLVIMVHGDGPATRFYFYPLKKAILRAGYATMMWDKPGAGQSTGKFDEQHLKAERAEILLDAIANIKGHPRIDDNRIGLWGISQAGWVIPMALEKGADISFMILVGCGGDTGIKQGAYLIRRQLEFAGYSEEEAKQAEEHFVGIFYAKSFEEYISHAKPLYDNPVQRKLGFVSALWDESNWKPFPPDRESFYNPITVMEKTTIPVLALFGELDTQVDPIQGAKAYKEALTKAGNTNFRVEIIPGVDHDLIPSETGSMAERSRRSTREWQNYAPEYLELLEEWLKELRRHSLE